MPSKPAETREKWRLLLCFFLCVMGKSKPTQAESRGKKAIVVMGATLPSEAKCIARSTRGRGRLANGFVKDCSRLKHNFKTADWAAYEAALAFSMRLYKLSAVQHQNYALELKARLLTVPTLQVLQAFPLPSRPPLAPCHESWIRTNLCAVGNDTKKLPLRASQHVVSKGSRHDRIIGPLLQLQMWVSFWADERWRRVISMAAAWVSSASRRCTTTGSLPAL